MLSNVDGRHFDAGGWLFDYRTDFTAALLKTALISRPPLTGFSSGTSDLWKGLGLSR